MRIVYILKSNPVCYKSGVNFKNFLFKLFFYETQEIYGLVKMFDSSLVEMDQSNNNKKTEKKIDTNIEI